MSTREVDREDSAVIRHAGPLRCGCSFVLENVASHLTMDAEEYRRRQQHMALFLVITDGVKEGRPMLLTPQEVKCWHVSRVAQAP